MREINVWMDKELHKRLKIASTLENLTIQEFIGQALDGKVKKDLPKLRKLL